MKTLIEATLEDIRSTSVVLALRIPFYDSVLRNIDKLSDVSAEFVLHHTKTCDGCGYCVKMDKTGAKPLMNIDLNGIKKCPFYPSFGYTFTSLDSRSVDSILAFFDEITAKVP